MSDWKERLRGMGAHFSVVTQGFHAFDIKTAESVPNITPQLPLIQNADGAVPGVRCRSRTP